MLQLCQVQPVRKMLSWVTLVKGPVLRINYTDKASVRQTHFVRLSLKRTKRSLKDIGTRFRLMPCWRLQHRAGRVVQGHYLASSACAECSSSGSQRNSQVRSQLDTSAPLRAPLAGCFSAYPVQGRRDCSSVSAGRCSSVQVRSSGVFCCRPDWPELATRLFPWSVAQRRHFRRSLETYLFA